MREAAAAPPRHITAVVGWGWEHMHPSITSEWQSVLYPVLLDIPSVHRMFPASCCCSHFALELSSGGLFSVFSHRAELIKMH